MYRELKKVKSMSSSFVPKPRIIKMLGLDEESLIQTVDSEPVKVVPAGKIPVKKASP